MGKPKKPKKKPKKQKKTEKKPKKPNATANLKFAVAFGSFFWVATSLNLPKNKYRHKFALKFV